MTTDIRIHEHPILSFDRGEKVAFTCDGVELTAYTHETIASALVANGIKKCRDSIKLSRPRGFFCGIGRCSSCNMIVNGVPNVRTCVTRVEDGMVVETQHGKGSFKNG